ncbi:MAG: hypothetical protein J3R72DRAFT_71906 [Linnemannia gamsii]|nr:MAG: hypothetical protein J3R72DRAFT_71906 [Linnemannia gamsii]
MAAVFPFFYWASAQLAPFFFMSALCCCCLSSLDFISFFSLQHTCTHTQHNPVMIIFSLLDSDSLGSLQWISFLTHSQHTTHRLNNPKHHKRHRSSFYLLFILLSGCTQ